MQQQQSFQQSYSERKEFSASMSSMPSRTAVPPKQRYAMYEDPSSAVDGGRGDYSSSLRPTTTGAAIRSQGDVPGFFSQAGAGGAGGLGGGTTEVYSTGSLREIKAENRRSFAVNQNIDFERFDLEKHSVRGLVEHFSKVGPPPDELQAQMSAKGQGESAPPLSYLHQQKKQRDEQRRRHREMMEADGPVNELLNYQSKNAISDYLVMDVEGQRRGATGLVDPSAILGGNDETKSEQAEPVMKQQQQRATKQAASSQTQFSPAKWLARKTDLRAVSASPTLLNSRIRPPTPKPFVPFGAATTPSSTPAPVAAIPSSEIEVGSRTATPSMTDPSAAAIASMQARIATKPPPSPKPPSRKHPHSRPSSASSQPISGVRHDDDFVVSQSSSNKKQRVDAFMADLNEPLPAMTPIPGDKRFILTADS